MLMVQIFFNYNVFMYVGETEAPGENPPLQECLRTRGSGHAGCHWATCSRTCAINFACFSTTVFVLLETVFFLPAISLEKGVASLSTVLEKTSVLLATIFGNGFFMIQHQFLMWFLKIQDHHLNWLFIWLRQHKYILNPCSGPEKLKTHGPSGSGKSSWLLALGHPAPFVAL